MWEVSWRLNRLQHIDPQVPLSLAALLSHSAGLLNRGSWGPKPSTGSWFSLPRTATRISTATDSNSGTELYHCLTSTCFPWASQFQPVHWSRWYLRYLRPDAPVSWLTAGSKVNMLHWTDRLNKAKKTVCPTIYSWDEDRWIHAFHESTKAKLSKINKFLSKFFGRGIIIIIY